MKRLGLLSLTLLVACNDPPITCFQSGPSNHCGDIGVGSGQPGAALAEGGEIRHEHVRMFGADATWIQVYQYKGPSASENAPFPGPIAGSEYGNCVDERDPTTSTWPFKPIAGATYLDLPMVQLTGDGLDAPLDVVRTTPPNQIGNSTFRAYDFTYGGGTATSGGWIQRHPHRKPVDTRWLVRARHRSGGDDLCRARRLRAAARHRW
jgi:hypothetical protein